MHETLSSNWREICPILLVSIHYIKPMKQVFVTVECFHFSMKPILWDEKGMVSNWSNKSLSWEIALINMFMWGKTQSIQGFVYLKDANFFSERKSQTMTKATDDIWQFLSFSTSIWSSAETVSGTPSLSAVLASWPLRLQDSIFRN